MKEIKQKLESIQSKLEEQFSQTEVDATLRLSADVADKFNSVVNFMEEQDFNPDLNNTDFIIEAARGVSVSAIIPVEESSTDVVAALMVEGFEDVNITPGRGAVEVSLSFE